MSRINKFDEFLNEGTNQNKTKWTEKMLQAEADKYETRKDFLKIIMTHMLVLHIIKY